MFHFDPNTNHAEACGVTPCEFNSHFDTALAAEFHHFVLSTRTELPEDDLLKDFAVFLSDVPPTAFKDARDGGEI